MALNSDNEQSWFALDGEVAVVTGGARHLGYDMADALASAGADLVISSRDLANAEASADRLARDHKVRVLPLELDVCDADRVREFADRVIAWQGRVDVLVNNAGGVAGQSSSHLFERDPRDMADLIATNLLGTLFCCQVFAQHMAARGRGKIINIGSIAGVVGRDRRIYDTNGINGQPIDYAAAKAGVIGMTRDLAGLLSPMGICVNAISPGGFGPRDLPAGFVEMYNDLTPLGRMGIDGVDIKAVTVFLATRGSDYVTGQNILVDGGFTVWK